MERVIPGGQINRAISKNIRT